MLAVTFANKADYDRIQERDKISIVGIGSFVPGKSLMAIVQHEDGSQESFEVLHTYNEQQIGWFRAGSALNSK